MPGLRPECSNLKAGTLNHDSIFIASITEPATDRACLLQGHRACDSTRQILTVRILVMTCRKLLIVQSHLQRDLYPSLVPTFRKEVYNMTPLHAFLSTALHANGTYITSKEKNKQWGANSTFRLGKTVERSPALFYLEHWYGSKELHKYLLFLQLLH